MAGAEAQVLTAIELPNGITIDEQAPRQVAFDGRGIVTPLPNAKAAFAPAKPQVPLRGSQGAPR